MAGESKTAVMAALLGNGALAEAARPGGGALGRAA
jgi:hypothetical protein